MVGTVRPDSVPVLVRVPVVRVLAVVVVSVNPKFAVVCVVVWLDRVVAVEELVIVVLVSDPL
jgi:hypothetical protein